MRIPRFVELAGTMLAGATIALGSSTGTPSDDSARRATHLSCKLIRVPENEADPKPFIFRACRTGDTRQPLVVWVKLGGTMTPGIDYVRPQPTLVIPAGKSEADLTISLIDDDLAEGQETIEVSFHLRKPRGERQAVVAASQPASK